MDYEELKKYQRSILERALNEGLKRNYDETERWSEYKVSHEKVIENLQTFLPELNVDCLVPIGKKALMRGKLTHTNEILVCLGDGYFAKYSASQAIALCNRRIERAGDILKNLEKEHQLYEMRKKIPEAFDAFGGKDRGDFNEYWDEEKLVDWRAEHRRREKEYREQLSELRNTEKQDIKTEEDLFAKLDALEMQEELEAELHRLEDKYPDYHEEGSDEDEIYEESCESSDVTDNENEDNGACVSKVRINTSNSETRDLVKNVDNEKSMKENETFIEKLENDSEKRRSELQLKSGISRGDDTFVKKVVFGDYQVKYFDKEEKIGLVDKGKKKSSNSEGNSDSSDEDIVKIEFKHSEREAKKHAELGEDEITSPRDIYRMLSKRRSILKKTEQSPICVIDSSALAEESETDSADDSTGVSAYSAIVHDITERAVDEPTVDKVQSLEPDRPVSKFKRERLKR